MSEHSKTNVRNEIGLFPCTFLGTLCLSRDNPQGLEEELRVQLLLVFCVCRLLRASAGKVATQRQKDVLQGTFPMPEVSVSPHQRLWCFSSGAFCEMPLVTCDVCHGPPRLVIT